MSDPNEPQTELERRYRRALADQAVADELLDNTATTALALFEATASAALAPAAPGAPAP